MIDVVRADCLHQRLSPLAAFRTWFLVSAPDVLWTGTPTSLAVTVVSELPVQVTAELVQGGIKVNRTLSLRGGSTAILTLPPIPGSAAQNSPFALTVTGYSNGTPAFTAASALSVSLRNVRSFVQTERSRYRPGDAVRIRSVSVRLDKRPFRGRVNVAVQDPGGGVAHSQDATADLGIALQAFNLPQASPLGLWTVTTTVNGVTDKKTFTVEHYARPLFDVLVKTPAQVLVGNDVRGSVRALYPSGQAVLGTLAASVALTSAGSPVVGSQATKIYGSGEFFFSGEQLRDLYVLSKSSSSSRLRVTASVTNKTNNSTGFTVNKTIEVQLRQNMFLLTFLDFSPTLKPSLNFSATLWVCRYDAQPLTAQDRAYPALVEVTQRRPNMSNAESKTLTLQVPEDGNVPIAFKLQDQVEALLIQARFQLVEETLTIYNNESSPSGSYIQISPNNSLPAQIGFPLQINAKSTFDTTTLHFVVSSSGQVVHAGTWSSLSFSLTPTVSWSPEACLTVYSILPSGEVVSDTARVLINQQNYVSLNWSGTEAQPGQRVSLSVATLEPRSQVGIAITGTRDEAPQDEQGPKVKQKCNMRTLTNAAFYKKAPDDGPKNESLMVETCWGPCVDMADSLLWLDTNTSGGTWTSGNITVPDGVASLRAVGLVMSDNLGLGFTPVPRTLTVSKDFSLALNLPSHLVRGEEIELEVNVINHLEKEIEVFVLLSQTKAFQFVLETRGNVSVMNAQKLNVGGLRSVAALFAIRAVALGRMEIMVDAVSAEASDSLVQRVLVKPPGVEQSYSKTLFLELNPDVHATLRAVSFSFPPNVVPGSRRAEAAVVGDILGLSISNLDSLVQLPLGCGEQNMIHFAPSLYILQYLDRSTLDSVEIRSRALTFLAEGYVRQLSYQRADGSFSAFGANDASGSTWLTAFVVRCFLQARTYISVDEGVLAGATRWLLSRQGPRGEFGEAGRLIHTEMQGGAADGGPVALTAYALVALLEDDAFVDTYSANVSLAQKYLEAQVAGGAVGNYSLSLAAYALALANSPAAGAALSQLHARADLADDARTWSSSAGRAPGDWRVRSAQVEMVAYVLLALFRRGSLVEGIAQLKWLSGQRDHLGGYGTTQDTAVALQALACYAAFSGANAIDLKLNVSSPTSPFASPFSINSTNYRTCQRKEINADRDVTLDISMEGRGFAIFQLNAFYSLEGDAFAQSQATDKEAFSLAVGVTDGGDRILLAICTRLKDSQVIPHTGMVILDVGMLSGFSLSGAVAQTGLIRKVEALPDKVILYLESLNKTDFCIRLQMVTPYKIAHLQEAVVQVYDYYEPTRRATRTYKSDALSKTEACLFCGENCTRCRAGLSIVRSNSVGSLTCSFSSLFLGIAASLLMK
ncbi:CD109 antigen-like isoform X2 [Betta splendens]|uniref:CD109 antigen-like isoform X2 n=1 Tax=Betta splendens TaxID=158456 RepID=A0A6P7LNQ2_BETSP|nr:CD109 antigen-like isoform X2 [Betta splendens]